MISEKPLRRDDAFTHAFFLFQYLLSISARSGTDA
jgi:hypothetical protein